ncbi:ATP-binding cassette domain-containing protein [Anaerocolumna sedimenticola]|uniref:ATP-binding cassette domain-containing protein n=1 Tax=Anaerocolumna sedimenticola TaxID=2696063 RepID=A0A6P1TR55_9FIRM|nr:ABC transporter ATP-binding protein [Anaerocolumna sedimenticola]QHQ62827.1 ATP-binding cassette domain-containing protein [Anaerocolumna sedimenticola]
MEDYILQVKNLKTYFKLDTGMLKAVDDVTFNLKRNETIGIIGESGCGKSVTAHSILRTVQNPGKVLGGEILYNGGVNGTINLVNYAPDSKEMRKLRGNDISMIFQEPMASLAPVYTIGEQMMEAVMVHQIKKDKKAAKEICLSMLKEVSMPNPEQRFNSYPHELSGGMCQRAMIAMALVNKPKILIADEPTTALDVTVQAQITDLMKKFQSEFNMSIIYITHDMGVIAEMADKIAVMYLGRVVESGSVMDVFKDPIHPYTKNLLKSMPVLGNKTKDRLNAIRGNVPVPLDPPDECGFKTRCDEICEKCKNEIPSLTEVGNGHFVRCFKYNTEVR